MKKLICLGLSLIFAGGVTLSAFAADRHHEDRSHHGSKHRYEHRDAGDDRTPLRWGKHRRDFDKHHMEAIHDKKLEHRYPGLHGYRWNGHGDSRRGFWHNDRYVTNGIVFFDRDDRMAGFGYRHNDVFIFVEESGCHEDRDDLLFLLLLFKILESRD